MKVIGVLLSLLGICGLFFGGMMYGDIGIACGVGALAALLSGIGFLQVDKKLKLLIRKDEEKNEQKTSE